MKPQLIQTESPTKLTKHYQKSKSISDQDIANKKR